MGGLCFFLYCLAPPFVTNLVNSIGLNYIAISFNVFLLPINSELALHSDNLIQVIGKLIVGCVGENNLYFVPSLFQYCAGRG